MRICMEQLKKVVPLDGESAKHTTQGLLIKARRLIKVNIFPDTLYFDNMLTWFVNFFWRSAEIKNHIIVYAHCGS